MHSVIDNAPDDPVGKRYPSTSLRAEEVRDGDSEQNSSAGHPREGQAWPERPDINRVTPVPSFATPLALSVVEGSFVFGDWMIRCVVGISNAEMGK
jgi:hypothetical protein